MKKLLFIAMAFVFALWGNAQNNFSSGQILAATKCRMIKMTAVMDQFNVINDEYIDSDIPVNLTLVYGAKSSGYASDDYIYLMYEGSDGSDCSECMGFMDYPSSVFVKNDEEHEKYMNIFEAGGMKLAVANVKIVGRDYLDILKSTNYIQVMHVASGKVTSYAITSCDFYDISGGTERLVLKGYRPVLDNYIDRNLLRVFADNMRKYYE